MKVLEIASFTPRRTRLRVAKQFRHAPVVGQLVATIQAMPEVESVEVNLTTGSILVLHKPMTADRFRETLPVDPVDENTSPDVLRLVIRIVSIASMFVRLPLPLFIAVEVVPYVLDMRAGKRISPLSVAITALGIVGRVGKLPRLLSRR